MKCHNVAHLSQNIQFIREFGGRGRARTGDPLLAKQVLSQLSYTPTEGVTPILKHLPPFRKLNPPPAIWSEPWRDPNPASRRISESRANDTHVYLTRQQTGPALSCASRQSSPNTGMSDLCHWQFVC